MQGSARINLSAALHALGRYDDADRAALEVATLGAAAGDDSFAGPVALVRAHIARSRGDRSAEKRFLAEHRRHSREATPAFWPRPVTTCRVWANG